VVLDPSRAGEALAPQVVLGIPVAPDPLGASDAAAAVQAGLRRAYEGQRTLAVILTGDPRGAVSPGEPLPSGAGGPPTVYAGASGAAAALPALLEVAVGLSAPACGLLEALPRPEDPGWLRKLIDPVLSGTFDLVAPAYARGRFDGVMITGIVYPLTRGLFGHRLRQPLGPEIVLSARLAELVLHDPSWPREPLHAGGDLWVITMALARECRMAQVVLGPRPRRPSQPTDVPAALARVLGTVFHEMERHAHHWMRVRGSAPVPTFGDEGAAEDATPPPSPDPLVAAFELGWQDLRRLWGDVMPPQTMLALQRIPREPAAAFRMPDALWAHVLYDFAVGWRMKVMDRDMLLRSLTPLYLGWVASFVNEVGGLAPAEAEERVERLCAAFEAEKRYLISRWRWPDRFSP
jgi:hypothetical protein